mgnify:CR=1 FL=1
MRAARCVLWPDRGVVHPEIAAHRADDDLAGIQTHADPHGKPVSLPELLAERFDAVLHSQGGVAGADGVILMSEGRAEQGHDAVAHHLIDGTFEAMDGFHHPLEHGVEDAPRVFRVAIGEELERATEIGEEDGDLLALSSSASRPRRILSARYFGV